MSRIVEVSGNGKGLQLQQGRGVGLELICELFGSDRTELLEVYCAEGSNLFGSTSMP
jgi:hypothetical protein